MEDWCDKRKGKGQDYPPEKRFQGKARDKPESQKWHQILNNSSGYLRANNNKVFQLHGQYEYNSFPLISRRKKRERERCMGEKGKEAEMTCEY